MTKRADLMAVLVAAMQERVLTAVTFCRNCVCLVEIAIRERDGMMGYGTCPQCGLALGEPLIFDESFPDPNPPAFITREPPICRAPRMKCGTCGRGRTFLASGLCVCGGAMVVA